MGEQAEAILDGCCCQVCGELNEDGCCGYPYTCSACQGEDDAEEE